MATDYTALDAAILEHIRSGSPVHPMHARACHTAAIMLNTKWAYNERIVIGNRLRALRRAGKIQHVKTSPDYGWIIVEPPTDG